MQPPDCQRAPVRRLVDEKNACLERCVKLCDVRRSATTRMIAAGVAPSQP
jgi:hypothetical protein